MPETQRTGPVATDADLEAGKLIGEYQICDVIGRGGFGTVYRAVHPLIGKQVAIKVLAWRYATDPAVVARFGAEARAVNQIAHHNIIDIFAFSQLGDGRYFYVMELLDGEPLDRYLKRSGPLPLERALEILRPIARALDAAHAKGIVHRDLKPENVFLGLQPDGSTSPKLLDFGIAKLLDQSVDHGPHTATGIPIGTPAYMSPEQCRGRDVDHRTDIYAFGVLAYLVLTGALPFAHDEYMETILMHLQAEPKRPSEHVPALARLDGALLQALAKDPARRPVTVSSVLDDLERAATARRRKPRSVAVIASLSVLVLGTGAVAALVTRPFDRRPTVNIEADALPADAPAVPDAGAARDATELAVAEPAIIERAAVRLLGLPRGAVVRIDGVVVGNPAELPLDDRIRTMEVAAPGYRPLRRELPRYTTSSRPSASMTIQLAPKAKPKAKPLEPRPLPLGP